MNSSQLPQNWTTFMQRNKEGLLSSAQEKAGIVLRIEKLGFIATSAEQRKSLQQAKKGKQNDFRNIIKCG